MLDVKDNCTGCGSCATSCPIDSIVMKENREGFRFPVINGAMCVECYICEKNCPILNPINVSSNTIAIATKNKRNDIRLGSSSGGVFSGLAESILADGGVIYAAIYNEEYLVIHKMIDKVEQISECRGAKYSQSQSEMYFPDIKNRLNLGQYVMYVGTPCQVAALYSYLGKNYPRLYLVDMVCHGVPSPKVWKRYLTERCQADGNDLEIRHINLRDKSSGWSKYAYSVKISYQNGKSYSICQDKDPYMRGFTSNLFLRKSCSDCLFKGVERCSDFTLGDYWGIWNQYPEFDDGKGVSLLLIHSEKGKRRWESVSQFFESMEVSVEDAIQYNPSALKSSISHPSRDEFFVRLEKGESMIELTEKFLSKENAIKESFIRHVIKCLKLWL